MKINLRQRLQLDTGSHPIIVVKIGSAGITGPQGLLQPRLRNLVKDITTTNRWAQVILVSSGAIQLARAGGLMPGTEDMAQLQALSALGQPQLMAAYARSFSRQQRHCGQVLVTHEDLSNRKRRLNLRNTCMRLLANQITPIVNENDSVSFAEITVGDNDQLAAMVAESCDASLLVLLTEPDGVFTAPPETPGAELLTCIEPQDQLRGIRTKGKSSAGRGGMASKITAVRRITPLGMPAIVASHRHPAPITAALEGTGSLFPGAANPAANQRFRNLIASVKSGAQIRIDAGAATAIAAGASLLASGVRSTTGSFRRGDCVAIHLGKRLVGFGISEYSASQLGRVAGLSSSQIKEALGHLPAKVVVHRNSFVAKSQLNPRR